MGFISVILMSLSILLPLVAGFFVHEKNIFLKNFLVFLLVGFITEVILIITSFIGNNVLYVNIYTIIETVLIGKIFLEIIKQDFYKNIIWVFIIIIVLNGVFKLNTNTIDYTTKLYVSLLVLFSSLIYFFNISETENSKEFNLGNSILLSGLIIFHASSILVFFLTKTMSSSTELFYNLYLIHCYINLGVNILYFIGFLFFMKKRKNNILA